MKVNTPQQSAVVFAGKVVGACQQLKGLRDTINSLVTEYNKEGYSNYWNAMHTAVVNADGTISATNDATSNTAHPITDPVGSPINKTATQLVNAVAMLQQLQNFFNNAAVTSGDYSATIENLAN